MSGADPASVTDLARRDEVLELLFWMKGQSFADALSVRDLARFLIWPEAQIARALGTLEKMGAVTRTGDLYSLTDEGLPEARRRFVDDFREMLAEGHGECNFSCGEDHEHDRKA